MAHNDFKNKIDKDKKNMAGDEADGRIEGRNPVLEAIKSGVKIEKLFISGEKDRLLGFIAASARESGAAVVTVDRKKLDAMSVTKAHQGVIAVIPVRSYFDFDTVLAEAAQDDAQPLFVVCDGITDPNNLGSIIRNCDAAGATAVIVQKRRSAGLTAAVSKASAGALEHVKVCRVSNITAALKTMKERGIWIFGAAGEQDSDIYSADFNLPAAIVIGSEGDGISRLVLEQCDFKISIPMYGKVSSLNAAAATAVILYEAARQRKAGKT